MKLHLERMILHKLNYEILINIIVMSDPGQ